jgi:hypothetical protein
MPGTPLFGSEFLISKEIIGGLGTYLPLTLLGGGKKKKSKRKSKRKSKKKKSKKKKSKRKTLKSFRKSLKSRKY